VASNATFDLITNLLLECTGGKTSTSGHPSGLFPDNMVHLGGDEVTTTCWSQTPSIQAWLTARNMTADDGYAYFVKRAASIAIAQGRRPVQWVEVFDHFGSKLDNRTIVHVWKDKSTLNAVVEAGYNALINNSPGSNSWYLDHLSITWEAMYGNEPCETISDDKQCA
jgi:hexosaminidase